MYFCLSLFYYYYYYYYIIIIIIITYIDKRAVDTQDGYNTSQSNKITSRYLDILRGRDGRDGLPGLQGEKGSTGQDGEKGEPGSLGPQGEKGEQGSLGLHGEKGEQGSLGPQGPQGVQGLPGPLSGGAVYTRWGRTVCPSTGGTELVYKGLVAGTHFQQTGGGANYVCITQTPVYLSGTSIVPNYNIVPKYSPSDIARSYLHGTEYEFPGGFSSLHDNNVPCAVCHTSQRTSKLMIPGTTACPQSWTEEYEGYLMAQKEVHKHNKVYECVDTEGEAVHGGKASADGALMYVVGAACYTGLPCPPFVANRPITCVVCTK